MATFDVIGLGAMNLDHLYRVDEIVTDGEQLVIDYFDFPGGSAANTIYRLAKLGLKTGFVGAVGSDKEGGVLIKSLRSARSDTSHIIVKGSAQTGATICISDKLGRRVIYLMPGANDLLTATDIDTDYINNAKFVHVSAYANNNQFCLHLNLSEALKDTVKMTLSPGMLYASKGIKALAPILAKSYVTFMNQDEVKRLTGLDYKSGARKCVSMGCRIVVITLGKGVLTDKQRIITGYIIDQEGEYEIESTNKTISDLETLGAGDAFAAGYIFGLLKNKSTIECGVLGDIMAQFNISNIGSRAGTPTLSELSVEFKKRLGCNL